MADISLTQDNFDDSDE
ncbi:hypothetical protein Trydic_g10875, partial [Trypoxylus dichotomus]